ncbi:MAG: helix-turn-helix domain-containing protein, partial [Firmicutes bacterium]|nr:helix-turn-helix domain-containing protein [Bacillota bacterium]MCR5056323.1 helix-turn-helix domain-containing protein [Clostridia bacterium]
MSQEELAGRLFVSNDLVSKWETGKRRPDWAMIEALA